MGERPSNGSPYRKWASWVYSSSLLSPLIRPGGGSLSLSLTLSLLPGQGEKFPLTFAPTFFLSLHTHHTRQTGKEEIHVVTAQGESVRVRLPPMETEREAETRKIECEGLLEGHR